jgi:translocator protein
MQKSQSRSLLALAGFGLAAAGAALYGARYSRNAKHDAWYRTLDKPAFTPPDKVYPAVWTALYALIAWSGWRIWTSAPSRQRDAALRMWITQLVANAQWSKFFFGEHRPTLALVDAIAIEQEIISYIKTARKVDRAAANAFIPYAAWVAFATVLNAEIARRNPHAAVRRAQA